MSYATAFADRLRTVMAPLLTDPHAPHPLRRAAADAGEPDDFLPVAAAMVPLILDTEAAAESLKQHAARMRQALAEVLDEAGAPAVRHGPHTAIVTSGRASVTITDPAEIPSSLMRHPAPAPDKAAILKLFTEGGTVPGATLGNSPRTLTIRSKS